MEIVSSSDIAEKLCRQARQSKQIISLVPTMGFFHAGHMSLIRWAKEQSTMLVVSLFVNPAQFGPDEDFDRYPQDLERDARLAEEAGVDLLFTPEARDIYPAGFSTWVEVESFSHLLCGSKRPGHFRGVSTIVCKLLNLIRPHMAVFGQKDWQQWIIIRKMVRDLNMEVDVPGRPTVREADGLAMSSRNAYLSGEERNSAPHVYQGLLHVRELFHSGQTDREVLENLLLKYYRDNLPQAEVDYVRIVDAQTLGTSRQAGPGSLAAVALKLGGTRLIDNILLE